MRPCQWPDDDGVMCGEPSARVMWRFDVRRRRAQREELHFCYGHMNAPRQKKVEGAGWYVTVVAA